MIMGFFGSVFAALTMHHQWHLPWELWVLPFLVAMLIWVSAVWVLRLPGEDPVPSERARRAMYWSSFGEGIGLFLAANIVINVHRPDLLIPAMAIVVGLHFLPMAFAASFRPFYILGAALAVAGILGFVAPSPLGGGIAGFMAALGLWIAAVLAVRRHGRLKRGNRDDGAVPG
nr:hypothetical protein [Mesoterricola silvestris]